MKYLSLLVFFYSSGVLAECSIEEAIDLLDEGKSTKEIRKECGAIESSCSITKIKRLYDDATDAEDIQSQCSPDARSPDNVYQAPNQMPASYCVTSYGSCPMMVAMPKGMSCYCSTAMGAIPGITQ